MDTESVALGSDWVDAIKSALLTCKAMVVVIGRAWVSALIERDSFPGVDFARFEVSEALKRPGIRVIPVLVGGATMPRENNLPADVAPLARCQALHLDDNQFTLECEIVVKAVESALSENAGHVHPNARSRRQGTPNVVVADLRDLMALGWTVPHIIDDLLALEYAMSRELTIEFSGTSTQWVPIMEAHPETWRVLLNEERKMIANWHFVALRPADLERAREGRLLEQEISVDKALYIDIRGFYNIYFVAAFIMPQCRQLHTVQLFRTSILDHFLFLAKQGVFINIICANAYTKEGEAFCKSFELVPGRPHVLRGRIYERALFPLPISLAYSGAKRLNGLYERAISKRSG